ncbi:MAG: GNAT family N-acetyltransferase [Methylobacter sp.]|nr:MAG: GNAT family N-acetyltransferase [Methylobacter sp.]
MTAYIIRAHDGKIAAKNFGCGQPALDDYIRRYALQDIKRDLARVFVATPTDDLGCLAGFFTLSAGSVNCSDLPEKLAHKLPRYPVPVALIGRLAVDQAFQGKGLGSILLADACQKVRRARDTLAVAGIIVDAKDNSTAAFYRHFGFIDLPGKPGSLLLPAGAFCQ